MKQSMVLVFLAVCAVLGAFGCSAGLRPGPYRRPPRTIDWRDHISVMRGFLSAKRRGDWQAAYRCCDYDETLPKDERAKIKKKWREEAKRWPSNYATTFWAITSSDYDAETASVRILVSRKNPITGELRPAETYVETLKKYKDKWKITNPLGPKASE